MFQPETSLPIASACLSSRPQFDTPCGYRLVSLETHPFSYRPFNVCSVQCSASRMFLFTLHFEDETRARSLVGGAVNGRASLMLR